jgi:hypothetical protein
VPIAGRHDVDGVTVWSCASEKDKVGLSGPTVFGMHSNHPGWNSAKPLLPIVEQLYELGKTYLGSLRMRDAELVFCQCKTLLVEIKEDPRQYRSLCHYLQRCGAHRALCERGLLATEDEATRLACALVRRHLPDLDETSARRCAFALTEHGLEHRDACRATSPAALRTLLRERAGLPSGHVEALVRAIHPPDWMAPLLNCVDKLLDLRRKADVTIPTAASAG